MSQYLSKFPTKKESTLNIDVYIENNAASTQNGRTMPNWGR